jgi:hypothetical protein
LETLEDVRLELQQLGRRTVDCNKDNWWFHREYAKLVRVQQGPYGQRGLYSRFVNLPELSESSHWNGRQFHCPRVAEEGEDMVKFILCAKDGARAVPTYTVMKIGRYLKRFYSDKLSDTRIKEIADRMYVSPVEFLPSTAIPDVYRNGGIGSCVSGTNERFGFTNHHPAMVYDNDGWEMAVTRAIDGKLTSRCLVYQRKRFVQCHGQRSGTVRGKLLEMGMKEARGWEGARIKMLVAAKQARFTGPRIVMPHLDGSGQYGKVDGDEIIIQGEQKGSDLYLNTIEGGINCPEKFKERAQ